jgi:Rps23 Pro-64 3,4-dihydroxylase Tpa1-like proline 4-hydroxylase
MFDHNTMVPFKDLSSIAKEKKEEYASGKPFPHIVIDNLFDEELLDKVIEEFRESESEWKSYETKYEKKLQMNKDENLKPVTRQLFHNLNSEPFLNFLSELTGIEALIPDPYLVGGGLHKIERGGKLGVHIDFNKHKLMKVYRRLNVIIYLNKHWKEEYGGHFELWKGQKNGCEKRVLPVFNRFVVFSTTNSSYHGHPEPLTCPEDRSRISLALYYYTAQDAGDQNKKEHSTVFLSEEGKKEILTYKESIITRAKRKLLG